jgi:hypothetical protein
VFGKFAPGGEPCFELFAIKRSAQQVALQRAMLPDWSEAREKGLRALPVPEAAHTPLAVTRRLMTVLRAVVDASSGFNEIVTPSFRARCCGRRVVARAAARSMGQRGSSQAPGGHPNSSGYGHFNLPHLTTVG